MGLPTAILRMQKSKPAEQGLHRPVRRLLIFGLAGYDGGDGMEGNGIL